MDDIESIKQHYAVLREYLGESFSGANRQPSTAMARVGRLPAAQFFDVSSDLYDELRRRMNNPDNLPFLPIRSDLAPKRNQARQKMATLPDVRFKELAAELYVEIERRFPAIAAEFERDQSSSLKSRSSGRGANDMSSGSRARRTGDGERDRDRTPTNAAPNLSNSSDNGGGSNGRRSRREPSSSSRSGRERERSRDPPNKYPSFRSEESSGRNGSGVSASGIDPGEEIAKLRSDYEFKIAMMEKQLKEASSSSRDRDRESEQIKLLQNQIAKMEQNSMQIQGDYDRLQVEFDRVVADFEQVSKETQSYDGKYQKLEAEYDQMRRDYDILQDDFEREQKITSDLETKLIQTKDDLKRLQTETGDNVKLIDKLRESEASFLTDIQVLKEKARSAESARDSLAKENSRLKDELKNKSNGAMSSIPRSASPLANGFASMGLNAKDMDSPPKKSPGRVISPAQSIKTIREGEIDTSLSRGVAPQQDPLFRDFEKYSFDLIDSAKSSKREQVLGPMKNILLICKEITQECEQVESDPGRSSQDRKGLREAKARLSESLTFLMQATKEHASNNGPSLVKKIDDEIKTLSYCVGDILELLRIVQLGSANLPSAGGRGESNRDTLRSIEPPSAPAKYDQGEPPALELPDLMDYIKDQVDRMDGHIKDLLQVMLKTSTKGDDLSNLANKIASCVDKIIYETQGTLDISASMSTAIMDEADAIVADLGDINNDLLDLAEDILDSPGDRGIKQKIANTSYEIKKQSTDLLTLLESA